MDSEIKKMLLELYTEEESHIWYESNNELLGGDSAKSLVEIGRRNEVVNVLQCILDGAYL